MKCGMQFLECMMAVNTDEAVLAVQSPPARTPCAARCRLCCRSLAARLGLVWGLVFTSLFWKAGRNQILLGEGSCAADHEGASGTHGTAQQGRLRTSEGWCSLYT